MSNLKIKHILFDFDGTLADTLVTNLEIFNELIIKYGHDPVDMSRIEEYRGYTAKQTLDIFNIPLRRLVMMLYHGKKIAKKRVAKCQSFPGIEDMLKDLKKNYSLHVLSSNSVENIELFLKKNKIRKYFESIDSVSNLFGKHRGIKKLIKHLKKEDRTLTKEAVIYIGDEVRDIEACRKVGIKIIAVTWGFNNRKILSQYEPEFLVDLPGEIPPILKSLDSNELEK
jgi:phosphoglycolate phosphatase